MTDRDHFAAAALAGLLHPDVDDEFAMPYIVGRAYRWADAMLRERGNHSEAPNSSPNLDAAPAARAAPSESSAPLGKGLGTGDTQSFDAYAMFAGSVMNWISEATSAADWSSDGGRKIMADACSRCWDAFDRIAPTDHGASPEARASVGRPRTDKADLPTLHGTGDTPVTEPMPQRKLAEVSAEPAAWYVRDRAAGPPMLFWDEERAKKAAFACGVGARPLYLCQDFSPKNLTLTDAEREAIRFFSLIDGPGNVPVANKRAATLRGLLERMGQETRIYVSSNTTPD